MKNIIIMVGVPGSGKSTWLKEKYSNAAVCSADHYHMTDGEYRWIPGNVGKAHAACLRSYTEALVIEALPEVAVDNTNTSIDQIAPYIALAQAYGYDINVIQILAEVPLAHARCIHNVPLVTINTMNNAINAMFRNWPSRWPLPILCQVWNKNPGKHLG